jgi:predicted  nucleic acid-binding Zn-ribbon protein
MSDIKKDIKKDLEILRKIKACDDDLFELNYDYKKYKKDNLEIFNRIQNIENLMKQIDEEFLQLKANINSKGEEIVQYKNKLLALNEDKNKEKDEKKIKEINEKIEIAELSIKVAEKEIEKIKGEIIIKEEEKVELLSNKESLLKIDVVKNITDIDTKISEINKNKKTFLNQLSHEVLKEYKDNSYDDMLKKTLSCLVKGFCDNCNLQATKQQELDMLEESSLVKCEYCGCIFVEIKK